MKKIITIALSVVLSSAALSAQDMGAATEAYNNAGSAVSMGDYTTAIAYFRQALDLASACGDEGLEIVTTCKDRIPRLTLQIAKDLIQEKQYDQALTQLQEAVKVGAEFMNEEISAEATELVPQVNMLKGNDLLRAKDFAGAVASYKETVAADPTNGMANLRLGQALASLKQYDDAEAAFLVAVANGQETAATKQLSSMYQRLASANLKAKQYNEAIANALKANDYLESATSMKIAGTAAAQLRDADKAISYLQSYLAMSPNARDADDMKYTIAVLAQTSGDNATACGYYKQILSSPKYAEAAKAQIEALKCE